MLAYLALQRRPRTREHLADLFWGEKSESRGRGNLSRVLHNISQLLPNCIAADRSHVRLLPSGGLWLDAEAFERVSACSDLRSLKEAAQLYRGDLLEGLFMDDCPDFELWLVAERENFKQKALHVLDNLVLYHLSQSEYQVALEYGVRAQKIRPASEYIHRQVMLLYALIGQRELAIDQAEQLRRLLADAGAKELSTETEQLLQRIEAGQLDLAVEELVAGRGQAWAPPTHLLAEPSPLIGRDQEAHDVHQRLLDPACRLVTLTGPGGIGKTHLALHVANTLENSFPDGVRFVALAALNAPEQVPNAIADALRIQRSSQSQIQQQLANYLGEKRMLLVLDNFEHLLGAAPDIFELLRQTQNTKWLITSRERLQLSGEWALPLTGLEVPAKVTKTQILRYGAVALFLAKAAQFSPDQHLEQSDLEPVVEICRFLEGSPLGIELAASWVPVLSPAEILREMRASYQFLQSPLKDLPERHRSLQAVFEHSWKLLARTEQSLFMKLAVFQGGFSREAMEQVVGGALAQLLALIDKSLVRRLHLGRFDIHALLREFALDKLAGEPLAERTARQAHARYYLEKLQKLREKLKGNEQKLALDEIELDIENVRAAWRAALRDGDYELLLKASESLHQFYAKRNWYTEARLLFGDTAAALKRAVPPEALDEQALLLAKLFGRTGYFHHCESRWEEAKNALRESLRWASQAGSVAEEAYANNSLGAIAWYEGDLELSLEHYQRALQLYRQIGDRYGERMLLNNLGILHQIQNDIPTAKKLYEQSYAIATEQNDPWALSYALRSLAYASSAEGDQAETRRLLEESLHILRELKSAHEIATNLYDLGEIALGENKTMEAARYLREAHDLFNETGDAAMRLRAEVLMGFVWLASARSAEPLRAALEQAAQERCWLALADGALRLATRLMRLRKHSLAAECLGFVLGQKTTDPQIKDQADGLLNKLRKHFSSDELDALLKRGQQLDVHQFIDQLGLPPQRK